MNSTKFIEVYTAPGKTSRPVRAARGKAGVYLIRAKGAKNPCYIGHSKGNLYKTLLRHFQRWEDPTQVRVTYPQDAGYKVRIVTTTPTRAAALEKALIIKYRPKDNPDKLELFQLDNLNRTEARALETFEDLPF